MDSLPNHWQYERPIRSHTFQPFQPTIQPLVCDNGGGKVQLDSVMRCCGPCLCNRRTIITVRLDGCESDRQNNKYALRPCTCTVHVSQQVHVARRRCWLSIQCMRSIIQSRTCAHVPISSSQGTPSALRTSNCLEINQKTHNADIYIHTDTHTRIPRRRHTRSFLEQIINYRIGVRSYARLFATIESSDTLIYLSKPLIILYVRKKTAACEHTRSSHVRTYKQQQQQTLIARIL